MEKMPWETSNFYDSIGWIGRKPNHLLLQFHYQSIFSQQFYIEEKNWDRIWNIVEIFLFYFGVCGIIKFPNGDIKVGNVAILEYNTIGEIKKGKIILTSTYNQDRKTFSYNFNSDDENVVVVKNNFGLALNGAIAMPTFSLIREELDKINSFNEMTTKNALFSFVKALFINTMGAHNKLKENLDNLFQQQDISTLKPFGIINQDGNNNKVDYDSLRGFGEREIVPFNIENQGEILSLLREKQIAYLNKLIFLDDNFDIKKERKIAQELNKQNYIVQVGRNIWKFPRKLAIQEINLKFGLNLSLLDRFEETIDKELQDQEKEVKDDKDKD